MTTRLTLILAVTLILLGGGLAFAYATGVFTPAPDVTLDTTPSLTPEPAEEATRAPQATQIPEKTVRSTTIEGAVEEFTFTASIPTSWEVESVGPTEALNFYDPAAQGETTLDKSQIFIRYFSANDFQTLTTVNIHNRQPLTVQGRPAVQYTIEKKATVADFPNQPNWRNDRHVVTDIRVSDANPSVFYVISKRPSLDARAYQRFLDSLQLTNAASPAPKPEANLTEPIAEFTNRITKKPFGIYITPQNSPVQPERFSGYHTASDVEYEDVTGDVPVRAIADGVVTRSGQVNGYGGLLVIQHGEEFQNVSSLYGHLKVSSLPRVGTEIKAGDQIGVLGEGGSADAGGERKHLHFGILKSGVTDIRGYVQNESELSSWLDPEEFLE